MQAVASICDKEILVLGLAPLKVIAIDKERPEDLDEITVYFNLYEGDKVFAYRDFNMVDNSSVLVRGPRDVQATTLSEDFPTHSIIVWQTGKVDGDAEPPEIVTVIRLDTQS